MNDAEYREYVILRNQAEEMTANEFAIRCLLGKKIIVIPRAKEIAHQLRPIGNNLNQIARAVNSGYVPPVQSCLELERLVETAWQSLKSLQNRDEA